MLRVNLQLIGFRLDAIIKFECCALASNLERFTKPIKNLFLFIIQELIEKDKMEEVAIWVKIACLLVKESLVMMMMITWGKDTKNVRDKSYNLRLEKTQEFHGHLQEQKCSHFFF